MVSVVIGATVGPPRLRFSRFEDGVAALFAAANHVHAVTQPIVAIVRNVLKHFKARHS